MGNKALFNATVPSTGSLANAHENILRLKRDGVFQNITGDINNFNPVPTPVTQPREAYGNKGVQSVSKLNDNWTLTFDVELVRAASGELVPAQAWLVDLLTIANAVGDANKAEFQWFDGLAAALPAHQGRFSVAAAPSSARGFADKNVLTFTLTSDGPCQTITSPIAGDGKPIVDSALPADADEDEFITVRGVFLEGISAATIGGTAAKEVIEIDPYTLVLQLPAGSAGSAPITVTNAAGAGESFPYVRGGSEE